MRQSDSVLTADGLRADTALQTSVNDSADTPTAPSWLARGQIPALNGLRACSILLVLIGHLSYQGQFVPNTGVWVYLGGLGRLGVDMFFVISGFLITLLLLREQSRRRTVSLKQFYLRRAFRILPAYGCFLLGVAFLSATGAVQLKTKDWIGAVTYTVSFVHQPSWDIGHLWSLSVEEHFYLLWPVAFCLWPRRAWLAAALVVLATPALRWLILTRAPLLDVDYCSLTRLDTIAVGCCLAYLATCPAFWRLMQTPVRHAYSVSLLLVALVAFSWWLMLKFPIYALTLHPFFVASAYAVTIWIWTNRSDSLLGRLLNSGPLVAIGLLSYSIYLWQQPFLNPYSAEWFTRSPVNLLCLAALAVGSYVLVERPFLKLKDRLGQAA